MRQEEIWIQGVVHEGSSEYYLNEVRSLGLQPGDTLTVYINSVGGSVWDGLAIYDYLKGVNFHVETRGIGIVASIASVILLAGKRVTMTRNCELMIHNPWAVGAGDADELRKQADDIETSEKVLRRIYSQKTGMLDEYIDKLMKNETYMDADEALAKGFIDEIIVPAVGTQAKVRKTPAFALAKLQNMGLKDLQKKLFGDKKPKAMVETTLEDGTAVMIDTGERDEIAVGDAVTITETGEAAPDGRHQLEDGRTITTEGGVITDIDPAQQREAMDDEKYKALEAENKAMKEELEALKAQNVTVETKYAELEKDTAEKFKAVFDTMAELVQTRSGYKPPKQNNSINTPPGDEDDHPFLKRFQKAKGE